MRRPFSFVSWLLPHASATSSSALFHGAIRPGASPWCPTSSLVGTCGWSSSSTWVGGETPPSHGGLPLRFPFASPPSRWKGPPRILRILIVYRRGRSFGDMPSHPSCNGTVSVRPREVFPMSRRGPSLDRLSPPPPPWVSFPSGLSFDPRRGRTGPYDPRVVNG